MSAVQSTALNMLGFLRTVLGAAMWAGMKYLPYAFVSSLGLSLSTGLVLWVWLTPSSGPAAEQRVWLEPLFLVMYAAIGVVWAFQRVIDRVAVEALAAIDQQAATLLDPLFDSIAEHDPLSGRETLSVAELRERWFEAKKQMIPAAAGRFALLGRLANRIARVWIDRQTAVIRQVLTDLAARGETHTDVASLARLFQQRAVRQLVAAGQRQLVVTRCWFYLPLLAAALLPPGACWLAIVNVG